MYLKYFLITYLITASIGMIKGILYLREFGLAVEDWKELGCLLFMITVIVSWWGGLFYLIITG